MILSITAGLPYLGARLPLYFFHHLVAGFFFAQASDEGYFLAESAHMERSDGAIQIKGLASAYSPSEPIEVSIAVLDESYDCGDLYITIEDSTGKTVSQNGYFKECFVDDGANLPTSETYSEKTDQRGKYTIEAKIYDRDRINSIHVKETFYIR